MTRPSSVEVDAENLTVTASGEVKLGTLRAYLANRGFRTSICDDDRRLDLSVRSALVDDARRSDVRGSLLAVEATLPDGIKARFGSKAIKDVAGYDLKRLYVGSGDAFGVVNEVTLRITPA